MPLPHFLCIGAQKAGTSWLFQQLTEHPALWLPPLKELHFFDHLFVPTNRRWTIGHIQTSARRAIGWHVKQHPKTDLDYIGYLAKLAAEPMFTEAWYEYAFSRPAGQARLRGDVTPEYSTIPEAGIDYLRRLLGPVKIIYIVREPVSRALSQMRMEAMRRNGGKLDEASWIKLAGEPDIENRGKYSEYIPRWKRAFATEDLHFIPYQKIRNDPVSTLRDIERFLGVGAHEYKNPHQKVHASDPLQVPDQVVDILSSKLRPETVFVEGEFGRPFAALT